MCFPLTLFFLCPEGQAATAYGFYVQLNVEVASGACSLFECTIFSLFSSFINLTFGTDAFSFQIRTR